ncbi:GH22253 [Drosophila grimshawi]|uniref:GH22253 n=1 Tax=Drosophila grimshawi TaxID=7222 RepID=B4K2J1_DROGR|nr:GH22253 [Drosophila grimshawi]
MLNELSEKFNKVTNLEHNIKIYKAEQIRQGNFLEELMSKIKESITELINQRTLLNEIVGKVNGSTTDRICQSDLLNKLTSLDPIQIHSSCAEVSAMGCSSGIHQILVPGYSKLPFFVSCDMMTQGGGWTTVLRREDGSVDFFRFWNDYKMGFGSLTGEFFIGLDKLHYMTKAGNQELLIEMENFEGDERHAKYDEFVVGSEEEDYKLITVGKYSGDAGDDLRYHEGEKFSTRDRDNDRYGNNCACVYKGAWWYHGCHNR